MQKLALITLAVLTAAPVFAEPAEEWLPEAQKINRQIMQEKDPKAREIQVFQDKLAQNQNKGHSIRLESGKAYTFFADCDRQCTDIDIKLTDSNDKTIKEDKDDNDSPVIHSAITTSGSYTLNIHMNKCEAATGCSYSIQAFEHSPWLPQTQEAHRKAMHNHDPRSRQVRLFSGRAAREQEQSHQVQLTAGKYYSFFADCDYACNDIDLALKSADGQVIKEDSEEDDYPMFGWRANRTGSYTLTVTMPKCSAEQCEYSSQVFMGTKPVFDR